MTDDEDTLSNPIKEQKVMRFKYITILLLIFIPTYSALGEPWLASRFSQNCAGCHSPGRKNLTAEKRRCSLSCQGCHVNPNGGGLRSQYGKWNENNWLKSFAFKFFKQKGTVAPFKDQNYNNQPTVVRMKSDSIVEQNYDRNDGSNFLITANSIGDFEESIAHEDPYFQKKESKFIGGADLRIMNLRDLEDNSQRNFLMSADVGASFRPTGRYLSINHELRLLGQFNGAPIDQQANQWQTKTFYGMLDDLPYNTYLMGGIYKPLFGNDHPDHTRLSRRVIASTLTGNPSQAYNIKYRAYGVGSAPNVPYLNLHKLQKQLSGTDPKDTSGYVMNLGLRFVSYGASFNYSLWQERAPAVDTRDTRILMHSLYGTTTLGFNRLHLGLEGISAQVERGDDFYRTAVFTLESYLRVWREAYLALEYSEANSLETLEEGYSKQFKTGLKWFVSPGLEIQSQWVINKFDRVTLPSGERRFISTQVHLFY